MTIKFHKDFDKQISKLSKKQREKVIGTVELFLDNPTEPLLRKYALQGEWLGYRSISAGGDFRLHFRIVDSNSVLFVAVGTHSQLYK